MASFQKGANNQPRKRKLLSLGKRSPSQDSLRGKNHERQEKHAPQKLVAVRVPPVHRPEDYIYYDGQEAVERIRQEFQRKGEFMYDVELVDGTQKQVSYLRCIELYQL